MSNNTDITGLLAPVQTAASPASFDPQTLIPVALAAVALIAVFALARWSIKQFFITAAPDQWLLRIRNGNLIDAGVGVSCWRRPGDVVAIFTSTLQRVRFTVEAHSSDRVGVNIEGFILWSVDGASDGPFRAFRQMGLLDLSRQDPQMRQRKHLLSTPQHRAFRTLLSAEVQRHTSTMSLDELLSKQDLLVDGLSGRLDALAHKLGIEITQVEIVQLGTQDPSIMTDLASEELEAVRQQARLTRLEAQERLDRRKLEGKTAYALQEAAAKESRMDADRQIAQRKQSIDAELALAAEADAARLDEARRQRQALDLQAKLDAVRAEAEAERDAALTRAQALEGTSPQVRDHQLQLHTVEAMTQAMGKLPIKDARWVTVGEDSPLHSIQGLVQALVPAKA